MTVVFYNGEDEKEDEVVLSLSNAFRWEYGRIYYVPMVEAGRIWTIMVVGRGRKYLQGNQPRYRSKSQDDQYQPAVTGSCFRHAGRWGSMRSLFPGSGKIMLQSIRNLMDSIGWTAEKAMDLLKIPQAQRTALARA